MSKMTRLMEQMQADLNSSEEAQNQEPETSTATTTEENSQPEESAAPEESASQEPPAEPATPAGQQAPDNPPEPTRKPSDYSPQERAEHAFRRQLARQKEKHEAELKARDERLDAVMKELESLKKQVAPKPPVKTRLDFPQGEGGDDAYITYLAEQKVNAIMAERDAQSAKAAEEKAAKAKEAAERDEEVKAQQKVWLDNVDAAFGADPARKTSFLKRVSYCTARGLGEVLDQFPVASDFLFNNPRGPFVLDKLLADRASFERVFNERNTNPMATYYELRRIDDELLAAEKAAQEEKASQAETQTQEPVVPHLGKPGRQAAGNSAPDIFSDPKAMKAWLRSH